MDVWKLQDAKARFSEIVERALSSGPQIVTRHGKNAVVIVSYQEFKDAAPVEDFKSFLLSSRGTSDLALTRDTHFSKRNYFEIPA
jgi:antitoxin Phd